MEKTGPNPSDMLAALTPTRLYWRNLQRQVDGDLDELLANIVNTPLFQHTYGSVRGLDLDEMIEDAKSATGMIIGNIFSANELMLFTGMGMLSYMNHGLALAARRLRDQQNSIPTQAFVPHARMTAFTFILKLMGEDLKNPAPTLHEIIEQLEISPPERLSLLQATMANVMTQSRAITLH